MIRDLQISRRLRANDTIRSYVILSAWLGLDSDSLERGFGDVSLHGTDKCGNKVTDAENKKIDKAD